MVVGVSEPAAGAFDVLDGGVGGLGAGVGDASDDEDFDLGPSGVDGVPQPVGLGHVRTMT